MRFTDEPEYFVSEASVYRLLKAHDLITSPAYIVIKAAEEFKDKTTATDSRSGDPLRLFQDHRLGLVLPLPPYRATLALQTVAWKLCATMKALDVTATLDLALATSVSIR